MRVTQAIMCIRHAMESTILSVLAAKYANLINTCRSHVVQLTIQYAQIAALVLLENGWRRLATERSTPTAPSVACARPGRHSQPRATARRTPSAGSVACVHPAKHSLPHATARRTRSAGSAACVRLVRPISLCVIPRRTLCASIARHVQLERPR